MHPEPRPTNAAVAALMMLNVRSSVSVTPKIFIPVPRVQSWGSCLLTSSRATHSSAICASQWLRRIKLKMGRDAVRRHHRPSLAAVIFAIAWQCDQHAAAANVDKAEHSPFIGKARTTCIFPNEFIAAHAVPALSALNPPFLLRPPAPCGGMSSDTTPSAHRSALCEPRSMAPSQLPKAVLLRFAGSCFLGP